MTVTDQQQENPAPVAPPKVLYTSIMQHAEARKLMESAAVLLIKAEKFQVIPSDADAEVVAEFRARLNQTIKDLDAARLASTEEHRALVAKLNGEANEKLKPMGEVLIRTDKLLKDYFADKEAKRQAALEKQRLEEQRLEKERQDAEAKAREANEAAQKAAADIAAAERDLADARTGDGVEAAREKLEKAQASQQAAINTAAQSAAQMVQLEQRQEIVSQAVIPAPVGKSIRGSHGSTTGLRDNWVWRVIDTPEQPASKSVQLVPEEYLLPPEERLDKKMLSAKAKSLKKASTTAVPGIEFYNDPVPASRTGR